MVQGDGNNKFILECFGIGFQVGWGMWDDDLLVFWGECIGLQLAMGSGYLVSACQILKFWYSKLMYFPD